VHRAAFLRSAALGSAALVGGGILPAVALAAPPTDDELAYANLGVATELLLADFYDRAAKAKLFKGGAEGAIVRARFNELEHADALSKAIVAAGQTAPVAEDFEFAWPANAFKTKGTAAALGLKLERTLVGVYLQAVITGSNGDLRTLFARILANEAAHLSVCGGLATRRAVGNSFPEPIDVETASDLVGPYLG
jgi:hypothetical protein